MNKEELLNRFKNISVWEKGDQRAPHKPIMLLYALAELQHGKKTLEFANDCSKVESLLEQILPVGKVINAHYPFWYLKNEGIWEVEDSEDLKKRQGKSNEPTKKSLKDLNTKGGFTKEVLELFEATPSLIFETARILLDAHFPETIQEDILNALQLDLEISADLKKKKRDPKFRDKIMSIYHHQCAICHFSLRLKDISIGVEAAHIKWHQANGPDIETNGICMCSLHHKLFDRGVFTIDEQMKIRVSDFTSGEMSEEIIVRFNDQKIQLPRKKENHPKQEFLDWHKKEVFAGSPI